MITIKGTDGTNDITQDFYQTNWNLVGQEDPALCYEATILHNPTSEVLNIRTSTIENVIYTLYDAKGRLVMQDKLSTAQTPIQVSQLAPVVYSIELIFEDGNKGLLNLSKRRTIKLIKQQ
jgi:hypothetical protein